MPTALTTERSSTTRTRLARRLLPVLYTHRLASTRQLHELLMPHTRSTVYLRRVLGELRRDGLVDAVAHRAAWPGQSQSLWFTTPAGCELVEAGGEVQPRTWNMSSQAAGGMLQEHMLTVVETGLVFTRWARRLGHECGPLSWEPEVAHRIRDRGRGPRDGSVLIADAVLHYTHTRGDERTLHTLFLEIDRCTEPVATLREKLRHYAAYRTYSPAHGTAPSGGPGAEAWRERYATFPQPLIVLSDAPERTLARRTADLRALVQAQPRLAHALEAIGAGVTTLTALTDHGPCAAVLTPLGAGEAPVALLPEPDAKEAIRR